MPFTESAADFYAAADFATTATYTAAGGGASVSVLGIFDKDYVEPFGAVEGTQIVYRTWAEQYPARPTQGATLVIDTFTYRVHRVENIPPNGAELRLVLHETT
jgi:hypothetical protein